jgi:hypothetical protein
VKSKPSCSRYENDSIAENYIIELFRVEKIERPRSIYFKNAYFISNEIIDNIFASFKKILISRASLDLPLNLTGLDKEHFSNDISTQNFEYNFVIRSESELNYTKKLYEFYKRIKEKINISNNLNEIVCHMDRFCFIAGRVNHHV